MSLKHAKHAGIDLIEVVSCIIAEEVDRVFCFGSFILFDRSTSDHHAAFFIDAVYCTVMPESFVGLHIFTK
jgi:hypothetical protein